MRLLAVDVTAARLGLAPGMALADARARQPGLQVDTADPAADAGLLEALAAWADRYTPLVGLDPPDGLLLDITGCAHLFGGEAALLADALDRLEAQGFAAAGAVAPTPGGAHALARHGGGIAGWADLADRLAGLPVAALRMPGATVDGLARMGLKTVGALEQVARAPLAARFGVALLRRLDEAHGRAREAITPRLPAPLLASERRFPEPLARLDDLERAIQSLAGRLCEALERRGEGARLITLTLFRSDGEVSRVDVGTARPQRDPGTLLALVGQRLASRAGEALDIGCGYDMIRLSIDLAAPLDPAQIDLSGGLDRSADVDALVDRLGARLGLAAVQRLIPVESHWPERSGLLVPAATVAPSALDHAAVPRPDAGDPPAFPVRLVDPPEAVETVAGVPDGPPLRFRWRRVLYEVARAEGPERIAAEWWRAAAPTRDYFRVEDVGGRRFWLYRDGLYGRETDAPRWYLHGLFG